MIDFGKLDIKEFQRKRWTQVTIISVFSVMGILAAVDIANDLQQGATLPHLLIEALTAFIALVVAAALSLNLFREARDARLANENLQRTLDESQRSAATWRAEAESLLVGLGRSIGLQFDAWRLTDVEKEIALFLLKGLSHKEIAHLRGVSDATVRQQSRSIYQKAGVTGRHGLAAFFLEDLSLPQDTGS